LLRLSTENWKGSTPLGFCVSVRPSGEGRPETERSGFFLGDKGSFCNGASEKTSGRSIFPNAPLRATSSVLYVSISDAIPKVLQNSVAQLSAEVGFALRWKLLPE
jgi:hypothetical protein